VARRRPRSHAVPCTACCCSTSRWAVEQRRLQKAKGCCAPRRPATPARWTRWPPACCRCASARPPSSARSAWTPTSATAPRCSLGQRTTTGDREGEVLETRPVAIDAAACRPVLARFTGAIDQVPPMHSALKHDGKALYEYARAGIEVERAARRVQIHASTSSAGTMPTLVIDVRCSKGTYIRTLAEDIGERAGLWRPPERAAPHRQRPAAWRRRRHAGAAGNHDRSRAA
jgi:hypothetical protein